jgi:hypothetical protein
VAPKKVVVQEEEEEEGEDGEEGAEKKEKVEEVVEVAQKASNLVDFSMVDMGNGTYQVKFKQPKEI